MEHTNLFLFENKAAFEAVYPDDKVDTPIPGVAYVRASGDDSASTYYNRMVTNYSILIHSKNKSGETVAQDYSIQTPRVLDGNTVKTNIVANPVEGYKPRYAVEKVEFTSASTEHTVIYLAATSYTVTVHHVFSGETLIEDTEILIDNIFEEDVVRVKIEPEDIDGYKAEAVYISVSGDMEYTLEYEEDICYVDLGLPSGTLWACKNLGAETPEDLGDAFAWGEIQTKESFTAQNYKWYDEDADEMTKYNGDDGKYILEAGDDAASVILGGGWHIPTVQQWYELYNNVTIHGRGSGGPGCNGEEYWVLESKVNGNSITVPIFDYDGGGYTDADAFWTNSLGENGDFYSFHIAMGCEGGMAPYSVNRWHGCHIRPVLGAGPQPGPIYEGTENY